MNIEIITLLQEALNNPWSLLFLAVWGIGHYIKEFTHIKPQWVLPIVGIVLGLLLVELSLGGGIIGFVLALIQMGLYDVIKPLRAVK